VEIGDDTNDSGDETQETAGVESASTKQPKKKENVTPQISLLDI